jgi:GAF domain-containing protein
MIKMNSTDPADFSSFSFQTWRENFVKVILIWASIFGLVAFTASLFNSNDSIYKAVYAAAYACLLAVTFIRLPYVVRAGVFLALIYILGLSGLFETGIWGDARVFFLAFIVMSALLFSPRAGITAIFIGILSMTIFGFLTLKGFYILSSPEGTNGTLGDWLTGGASLIFLGTIAIAGLNYFQTEFLQAQAGASETLKALQAERKNLEIHVAERTDELEKRNSGMRSTVFFTRQLAEIQDPSAIPAKTVDLISQQFGYHDTRLFLMAEDGKTAILQASASEAGRKLLQQGYRVRVGDLGLVERAAERAKLIVSNNKSNTPPAGTGESEMSKTQAEIALPLMARGKVIGVLDIQSEQIQAFNREETEILQLLAEQIGVSIDNARLLSEAQAFVSQLEVLTSKQTQSNWRENLINQRLAYQFTPLGTKPVTPGTKLEDHNNLIIPLVLRGHEIGSIVLQRKDKGEWAEPEQDLVKKVAIQVALALDNSRLIEETRQHAVQEQTVNEISARFSRSLDVDTLLQTAVRELAALPDVSEASVYITPQGENK